MWRRSAIPALHRIARRVSRKKPILALKARRGGGLARGEPLSDTAAALRGDAVADALLHQAGVLRFRGGEELFEAAVFFESQPLPSGREIGIVSNSPPLATLAPCLRGVGAAGRQPSQAGNPLLLGISAGPDEYAASIGQLPGDAGIDALTVYYSDRLGGDPEAVLEAICAVSAGQPSRWWHLWCGPMAGCPHGRRRVCRTSCSRVVCGRARSRGRTPRLAVTAARPSALPRAGRDGGARADRCAAGARARRRLFHPVRRKRCWPRMESRWPPRIAAASSSARSPSPGKAAARWH